MTTICGVDPGLNGAFAFIDLKANTLDIIDMPTFEKNGKRHVDAVSVGRLLNKYKPSQMYLELVHSSPQMGVTSAFSFGRSSGIIHGAAGAAGIIVTEIAPSVWKPRMGCTSDKKQTSSQASRLMPSCAASWKLVKHSDRAEAALIGIFGCISAGTPVQSQTLTLKA